MPSDAPPRAGVPPIGPFSSVRAKLLLALLPVVALATLVSTGGLTFFLERFFAERMTAETMALSEAIKASLQQQMLQRVPELTQRTLMDLGTSADIRRVLIVNRAGRVAHAIPATERGRVIDFPRDPDCAGCHASGPPTRRSIEVTNAAGERVYRISTPIENQPRCQGCHGTTARLNGMLFVERGAGAEQAALRTIRSRMAVTWAITLVALAALVLGVTTALVHRPVRRLIHAARRIGEGDLTTRVDVRGHSEIAELGATLNRMANDLASTLKELRGKTDELSVLYSIVDRMSRTVFIGELKPLVLEVVGDVLRSPRIVLVSHTDEAGMLEVYEQIGGEAFRRCARLEQLARATPAPTQLIARWMRGELTDVTVDRAERLACMPLRFRDRDLALMLVSEPRDRSFTADDVRLMNALGGHIAVAFENARLYTLAITDDLTQLYSVRHLRVNLEEAVRRFKRYGERVALVMLDIDRFKLVNDTHGHAAGDTVLKEVARRIRATMRDSDVACRYGGEEFAIILPHTDRAGARIVAERVREVIASDGIVAGDSIVLTVTVSAGIAACPADAVSVPALVRLADEALYRAKREGRNRVCAAGIDADAADVPA